MDFLAKQPMVILLLCLAVGAAVGRIKFGRLPSNATLTTIFAAVTVNVTFRKLDLPISYPDVLPSLAFAFFSFALGYSAGPGFEKSIRRNGFNPVVRQLAMALSYCLFAGIALAATVRWLGITESGTILGLLAGSVTQSTILDQVPHGDARAFVAYAIGYVVGMVAIISFVQTLAPRLFGATLVSTVKRHMEKISGNRPPEDYAIPASAVQIRSFKVPQDSLIIGKSVAELETAGSHRFEIAAIWKAGKELTEPLSQSDVVEAGDVISIIGDIRVIPDLPNTQIEEVFDDRFISASVAIKDVVLSDAIGDDVLKELDGRGILLLSASRNGIPIRVFSSRSLQEGDVLRVAGLEKSVGSFVSRHGYVRDDGAPSDVAMLGFALVAATVVGAVSLRGVSLGTGCCALLAGMMCGCIHERTPRMAHIPAPALAILRTLGLNVFIASRVLNASLEPSELFSVWAAKIALASVVIAFFPLLASFLLGRFVLRLSPVPLLGGLCGAGTSTPALNALEDETGASVFTESYAPAYVFGNIILTLLGVAVPLLV